MIWQLMRRDPAWRWIPWLTPGSAAFCLLWQWAVPHGQGPNPLIASLMLVVVFALLGYAIGYTVAAQRDDTRFQSVLPVTVRQIYLARTISAIAMLWIPVSAGAVMGLFVDLGRFSPFLVVNLVSVFALTAVILQVAIVRGVVMPTELIHGCFMLWAASAGLVPVLRMGRPDPLFFAWAIVPVTCWLSIAVIVLTTWRAAPESFQSAPLKPAASVARAGKITISARRSTNPRLLLWSSLFQFGGIWIIYAFVGSAFFGSAMLSVIFASSLWTSIRSRVGWLIALPVTSVSWLPALLLPYFLALGGGYLVSVHRASFTNTEERRITVRDSQEGFYKSWPEETPTCKTMNIIPALEFWVPGEAGRIPSIVAPWGETFPPRTSSRFGFDVFNPYAVGCNNSQRFFDWQFSRATLAVYGRPIARREFAVGDTVDSHLVITSVRMQVVNLAVIACYLIVGMIIPLIGDWHRFHRLAKRVRIALYILAGAIGLATFAWVETERFDVVQWLYWALPASLPVAVFCMLLGLVLLYLAAHKLVRETEFIDKPVTPDAG